MNMLEQIIVVLGISLEIFGAMECQGSLVAKIDKKQLLIFCSVLTIGQTVALGIGNILSRFLSRYGTQEKDNFLGQVISAAILLFLGIRLLHKAWRNEGIVERREERFEVKRFLSIYVQSILFTFLAGFALGFLGSGIAVILVVSFILTVLVTVIGMYTGYHLGFEHKMKAYVSGGLLLIAGGVGVILGYI